MLELVFCVEEVSGRKGCKDKAKEFLPANQRKRCSVPVQEYWIISHLNPKAADFCSFPFAVFLLVNLWNFNISFHGATIIY